MGYFELYSYVQTLAAPISRKHIKPKTLEYSDIPKVKIVRSTLDTQKCRGYFLSADNKEHALVRQNGCHIIVLARGMSTDWERLVEVKELMHCFDSQIETTDSGVKFENVLNDLIAPTTRERCPQFDSEILCLWMALGVLCPENYRIQLEIERAKKLIDDDSIATILKIPPLYVQALFSPSYKTMINIALGKQDRDLELSNQTSKPASVD